VEDWITEARRLNDDVKRSEAAARDIVRLEAERQGLEDQVHDLEAKQGLLRNEIAFSDALFQCLLSVKDLKHDLDLAEERLQADDSAAAIEALGQVEARLLTVKGLETTAVLSLLGVQAAELRRVTVERAETSWDALFAVDGDKKLFSVKQTINGWLWVIRRACISLKAFQGSSQAKSRALWSIPWIN
jgi:centromere/kinetochore protein ZW10